MTIASDIAGDHAYIDGVETVTFTPMNPAGTPVATAKGLKRVLSLNQIAGIPGLQTDDLVWHLWNETLGGNTPKQGDTVTDTEGDVWTILHAMFGTLESRWRCLARKNVS